MTVDEKIALLEIAIAKLKVKYCENCQEYECDDCPAEVDDEERREE